MATGELAVLVWQAGSEPPRADGVVILCVCFAHRRADAHKTLLDGVEVAPSQEVVEETVVRHDVGDGVFWPAIERQLAQAGRAA